MTFSRALSPSNPNSPTHVTSLTIERRAPSRAIQGRTQGTKDLFPRADLRRTVSYAVAERGSGWGSAASAVRPPTIGEGLQASPAGARDPLVDRAALGAHDFLHGHTGVVGRNGAADKPRGYVSFLYSRTESGTNTTSSPTIQSVETTTRARSDTAAVGNSPTVRIRGGGRPDRDRVVPRDRPGATRAWWRAERTPCS